MAKKPLNFWGEEASLADALVKTETLSIPSVVVIDGLDEFRSHLEWPTGPDGKPDYASPPKILPSLDLSEVDKTYGKGAFLEADFVVLPALSDQSDSKRAFRMEGSRLLPPEKP